ncbi:MAG: hypothetical protein IPK97_11130 [Ahniella sp.]|nr:hypothetical protein [Ahniella sp.]
MADPSYLQEFAVRQDTLGDGALGLYAHRITAGSGLVLAYRWYTPGSVFTIDDEGFEKLTVWLPDQQAIEASVLDISSPSVLVVYTRGGAAWPKSACSGWLTSGTVRLEEKGSAILVDVSGELRAASGTCPPEVKKVFSTAALGDIERLTPWLGAKGRHPYDESYRH